VRVTDFSAADPAEVHELIYGRARWADVPGHVHRDLQNWTSTFVTDRDPADQQVLAWRGDELVGAALGRVFDDGGGWVAQLAVADSERRVGLGRAQLLEAFARRVAAGATTLGLGAQAENSGALALYTSIGLRIEREWRIFAPPP
jgi:ribosomal protein S18 acetylase RimI-like enzyme